MYFFLLLGKHLVSRKLTFTVHSIAFITHSISSRQLHNERTHDFIYQGNQVNKVVMGEECGMHRTVEKWINIYD
jgi:hypothetical protein